MPSFFIVVGFGMNVFHIELFSYPSGGKLQPIEKRNIMVILNG
jgi:hypothetical protein